MTTPIADIPEIAYNQANKYITHNEAIRILEAMQFGAQSISQATEPTSPTPQSGQMWILPALASPAGGWAGFSQHDVAIYNQGDWHNFSPWEGLALWVNDVDQLWRFDGTAWKFEQGSGATGSRPTVGNSMLGARYFDTTLGYPIWNDGTNWVDSTGTTA